MGMFSTIGNIFMPGIGGMVGGLIDSSMTDNNAQGMQGDVNQLAQQNYQNALPWNASGTFGGITYDRDGRTVSSSLSAPWQSQMDALLGQSTALQSQIDASTDPIAYGQQLAQQQKDAVAGDRRRAMLSREARSIGQGTSNAMTNIYKDMGVGATIAQQDAGYDRQGFANALTMGNSLRDWQQQALEGAADIGRLPDSYRPLAMSGAVSTDPYASDRVNAAGNVYQGRQTMFDSLGNQIGGMLGGGNGSYGDWAGDASSDMFDSTWNSSNPDFSWG